MSNGLFTLPCPHNILLYVESCLSCVRVGERYVHVGTCCLSVCSDPSSVYCENACIWNAWNCYLKGLCINCLGDIS